MRKAILCLVSMTLAFEFAGADTDPVILGAQQIANEIVTTYKFPTDRSKPKIAVLEFSDLDGRVTDFGKLLSEELITRLFMTSKFDVVERMMLAKVVREHKLAVEGIVDPNSAKELGKILGVDAIVSGTHGETSDGLRINARVVSTETGQLFAVASTTVSTGDRAIGSGGRTAGAATDSLLRPSSLFHEDFSEVSAGLLPDGWQAQDEVMVRVLPDGTHALSANANGNYRLHIATPEFPKDFRLSLRLKTRHWVGWHEEGQPVVLSVGNLSCTFRATGTVICGNTTGKFPPVSDQVVELVLEKQGPLVRFKVEGTEALLQRVNEFAPPSGASLSWQTHTDDKGQGGTTLVLYDVRLASL